VVEAAMRGGRSFVVLLVVALGLGAYIYFVESRKDLTSPVAKKDKLFTAVESGKIEEIEVHAAAGEVTRLKKSGDKWQIVAPLAADADSNEISTLASTLESTEVQRVLDEQPKSVKDFGLEPARFSVAFRQTGETAMRRLDIGAKNPTGSDLYARVDGQPRLLLLSSSIEDSLNRTTFNLRDKTVLKFDRTGADMLKIDPPGGPSMAFARKGDLWRFTAPVDTRADFSAVDAVVQQVFAAKMKAIISATEPNAADMKKYGLDKPQAAATVGVGSTRATLAIGGKMDDTSFYARDVSRPTVFTVEAGLLDGLKKKSDDLRVKDAFEFRTFTALNVDVTLDGKAFTYAKVKAPPPPEKKDEKDAKDKPKDATPPEPAPPAADIWKQLKPAAKDVDQTKFTDLLTDLSNLKADKFTEKPFTSGQELIIVAKFGDATSPKEERVTLRKSGDVVHAIRAGEPGAAIVPTADFDKIVKQLKELADIK
jgi:hypothetical protein